MRDYWVSAVNFGAPGGQFTLVRPIAKYADLDRPGLLQQAGLSAEAINKINARRNALLAQGIQAEVFRFIPELSFGMPKPATN